jgi:nuclear GTP-binding protein
MVKKKTKSKRLSLHKKYKIARKVREHKRQERKKEKNGFGRKKKDPGIPNNWPFKEELLLQVEQARLAELESQRLSKEQKKQEKKEKKRLATLHGDSSNQFQELTPVSVEMQHKKDLKEAVRKSDFVFIVLDARDPQGSRSLSLEDGLIAKGKKKVVLVLNKVDLIAPETAEKVLPIQSHIYVII